MWNPKGIGMIARFLGIPLLTDNNTFERSRMSFATVCVEIDIDFDYPTEISVVIDGNEALKVPVEYTWKPPKCQTCKIFGHSESKCLHAIHINAEVKKKAQEVNPQKSEWVVKGSRQDKKGTHSKTQDIVQQVDVMEEEVSIPVVMKDSIMDGVSGNGETQVKQTSNNEERRLVATPTLLSNPVNTLGPSVISIKNSFEALQDVFRDMEDDPGPSDNQSSLENCDPNITGEGTSGSFLIGGNSARMHFQKISHNNSGNLHQKGTDLKKSARGKKPKLLVINDV